MCLQQDGRGKFIPRRASGKNVKPGEWGSYTEVKGAASALLKSEKVMTAQLWTKLILLEVFSTVVSSEVGCLLPKSFRWFSKKTDSGMAFQVHHI